MTSPRSTVSSRSSRAKSSQRPTSTMRLPEIKIAPLEIGLREIGSTARARRSNLRLLIGKPSFCCLAFQRLTIRRRTDIISLPLAGSFSFAMPPYACALSSCCAACEAPVRFFWRRYRWQRKGQPPHLQRINPGRARKSSSNTKTAVQALSSDHAPMSPERSSHIDSDDRAY